MKCYFITGVSSGIGEALVKELLSGSDEEILVKGCSRRASEVKDARYVHYTSDLSLLSDRVTLATAFFQDIPAEVSSLVLINNAGFLGTIGSVGHIPEHTYDAVLSTNLIAPAFLCDEFIRRFQALAFSKVILNISSGAANKDYAGWAAYCASKAGLDRFSSVVALEQQSQPFPIHIESFAPGVIDTPMQGIIRLSNEKDFPSVSRFLDLYENGGLLKPETVARKILQMVSK